LKSASVLVVSVMVSASADLTVRLPVRVAPCAPLTLWR